MGIKKMRAKVGVLVSWLILSVCQSLLSAQGTNCNLHISSKDAYSRLAVMVEPRYPTFAKTNQISGSVVLAAVIAKDGSVDELKVISGHPLLIQVAIDAVKQWIYRPYIIDGKPVCVHTQITMNFLFDGSHVTNLQRKRLSKKYVLELLLGGVSSARVGVFVRIYKVDFPLTDRITKEIRAAGGDIDLIRTISESHIIP